CRGRDRPGHAHRHTRVGGGPRARRRRQQVGPATDAAEDVRRRAACTLPEPRQCARADTLAADGCGCRRTSAGGATRGGGAAGGAARARTVPRRAMTMRRLRLSASRRFGAGGAPPIATPAAARRRSFLAADVRLVAGGVWAILRDAGRKFYADDCATLAAAISFYALLSLIPVLFLIVAILGYVLGSSQYTVHAVLAWA